jgi:hypothetical protein
VQFEDGENYFFGTSQNKKRERTKVVCAPEKEGCLVQIVCLYFAAPAAGILNYLHVLCSLLLRWELLFVGALPPYGGHD